MRPARIAFFVVAALLVLVPPWQQPRGYVPDIGHIGGQARKTALPGGHAFLLNPPAGRSEIAFSRLAVEIGAAALLTFGAAWAFRRERT